MLQTFIKKYNKIITKQIIRQNKRYFSTKLTTCSLEINSTKEIAIIPVLSDNYSYLLMDHTTKNGIVVDPADAKKIYEVAEKYNINIIAILNTHKHDDHVCGNIELQELVAAATNNNNSLPRTPPIYGPDDAGPTPGCTDMIKGGDIITIDNFKFHVISTPCHTEGHVTFYSTSSSTPVLFPGDTIFLAGCGRFFEGTGTDMYHSMNRIKEQNMPLDTKIFCGHEYSLSNLAFAQAVEPSNMELNKKLRWVIEQRNENLPTIPSTWGEELSYNPFLRLDQPEIQTSINAMQNESMEDIMSKVRLGKDNYAFNLDETIDKAYINSNNNSSNVNKLSSFTYDYEPNLNIANYERTTPIVFLISKENKRNEKYMNLIEKISNLGFFSREIVFTDESIFTKECRKNGARKSNLIKSCVASLFTNTTDLTPPIVIAEGIFGFIAQKYLESYALSALCLLNTFPPNPSVVVLNDEIQNNDDDDEFMKRLIADALLPERQLNLESNVLPIYSLYSSGDGGGSDGDEMIDQLVDFHHLNYDEDVKIFNKTKSDVIENMEDSFCEWLDEHF